MFDWRVAVAYSSIGPYQITRPLGQGGMGAVYEAISPDQGHRVAIKVLHARHTHSTEAVARFFNEAKAVNLIGHEGLVKITEHGHLPDGSAYLVMEYLAGDNLAIHLHRQGRMSERDVLRVAGQLASVLAATHAAGIVHRDLKPGNVMLVPDNSVADGERVKLLDFGIAKLSLPVGSGAAPMTHVGAMLGTPQYMSPEQCRGSAQLDGRSDVYSLGIMMFQMLAGQLPFETPGSEMGVVALHLLAPVPSLLPLAPQTRPALAQLVERMLAKAKEERPSMAEVVEALRALGAAVRVQSVAPAASATLAIPGVQSPPIEPSTMMATNPSSLRSLSGQRLELPGRNRRPLLLGGAAAVVALAVTGVVLLQRGQPTAPSSKAVQVSAAAQRPSSSLAATTQLAAASVEPAAVAVRAPAATSPVATTTAATPAGKTAVAVSAPHPAKAVAVAASVAGTPLKPRKKAAPSKLVD